MLNDSKYKDLRHKFSSGYYDAIHVGFPCSTGALSRLFDADGDDKPPPMVRNADHPDGIPESEIDPKHIR